MEAKKVYGATLSGPTNRVLACLYEKDIEFEFVPVDLRAGAHKKECFLAKNPFGQVPVFEDGDFTIFESRAINYHISHVYGDKGTSLVFVGDSKKMTTLSVWIEVEAHQFDPIASKLVFELLFKSMFGMGPTDEAVVAELEGKLAKVLDIYEARLSHNKYLSGDCFGLADLNHLPALDVLTGLSSKKLFEARPHVAKWAAEILARPSWVKVLEMRKN